MAYIWRLLYELEGSRSRSEGGESKGDGSEGDNESEDNKSSAIEDEEDDYTTQRARASHDDEREHCLAEAVFQLSMAF